MHRIDRHFLAMKWKEYIYIDRRTPFGLRSALKLFDILADILSWIAQKRRISYVIHYLDDFLTMGPPSFPICQQNQNTFIGWCSELGVPFPQQSGGSINHFNIPRYHSRYPAYGNQATTGKADTGKADTDPSEAGNMVKEEKSYKREILSLVGLLQHATKVVRPGRTFVARMPPNSRRCTSLPG